MKKLWLVGESLPLKEDGSPRRAFKSAKLPETLTPLDPRHGVFPNLVMKPLFAAGFSLSQTNSDKLLTFFREINEAVADKTDRRLNVFENRATRPKKRSSNQTVAAIPAPEIFEINCETMKPRIAELDAEHDLWLVFGHQTNFGLLWWLIDSEAACKIEKDKISGFSERFVAAVHKTAPPLTSQQTGSLSGRVGLLHRLCTGADTDTVLADVINALSPKPPYQSARIVEILRSIVPLLHNEGYQDGTNPTGNAQAHFVRNAVGTPTKGDLYWQVMGNAIATRILGGFVE